MVARKTKARKRAGIDAVPSPDLRGAKLVPARVTKSRDVYFLVMGRRKQQIPLGPLTMPSDLDPLVGVPVTAVISRKNKDEIIAIGSWPTPEAPRLKLRKVLCYVPAAATLRRVRDVYRKAMLEELVAEGAMTNELADGFRS